MDFTREIRFYVSDVVFYCADYFNLLPVVHNKNNRRRSFDDEQESFKEIPVLGEEPARGLNGLAQHTLFLKMQLASFFYACIKKPDRSGCCNINIVH